MFSNKRKNIGFEDIKYIITHNREYILINTLTNNEQQCLIIGTIQYNNEEYIINQCIEQHYSNPIIIYGKHSCDETVEKKYNQLFQLGFENIYVYMGGLFEWLLLQDIYGFKEFPTTTICKDLLQYRPRQVVSTHPPAICL
jgi:hypothetical protein